MSTQPWRTVAEFREVNGHYEPFVWRNGKLVQVAWAPYPGSQDIFLGSPEEIVLFQGARGACGKTECIHVDFLQYAFLGMGAAHDGIIFKPTYPDLEEPRKIGKILIPKFDPGASWNGTDNKWTLSDGATLSYRPFPDTSDTETNRFLGRNLSWAACDELATYRTADCFLFMLSTLRCTHPLAPNHLRASTNTWGPGRDWILEYFQINPALPSPTRGPLIVGGGGPARRVVTGRLEENLILTYATPGYAQKIAASVKDQPEKAKAWLEGIWAAPPTAFFGHVDFDYVRIPDFVVPTSGRIRWGLDHGISAPTAALAFWVSKGEDLPFSDGSWRPTVKGDIYAVAEYYGAIKPNVGDGASPSKIGGALHAICEKHNWNPAILRAHGNYADTSIFAPSANDRAASTAHDLERAGCVFEPANKARVLGATQILKLLLAAKPPEDAPREEPALFITESCKNLLRSLPNMQRADDDPDDVSTDGDDHCYDALRFFIMTRDLTPALRSGRVDQLYPRRARSVVA